ncbi:MAG: hypothetical protein SAK42_09810 [Oscillatoria sp. PMC 1076.18]|nr:hypothetical protein [Oscillatoria sp. PMC 1076.18]
MICFTIASFLAFTSSSSLTAIADSQQGLKQYPENREIISNVFGYFRDYLDFDILTALKAR